MKILIGVVLLLATLSFGAKILKSNIDALSFYAGAMTTTVRTESVPQLRQRPRDGPYPDVNQITCANTLYGQGGSAWNCTVIGGLPSNIYMANADVACEGYSSDTDDYVLVGSCYVRYDSYFYPEPASRHIFPPPGQ